MSFVIGLQDTSLSQLSPGTLAKAHSHLEGNLNCTKCHTLGEKVENSKCLDCHTELKTRIQSNKGYHAHPDIKSKACASCHNDHHGLDFKIVKFDEKAFDHAKTGYALTGKHAQVDCRQCHKPAFIPDEKIRNKQFTYLGLETNCSSCHNDVHRNSLSKDCARCHTTQSFKPASLFNHNTTAFPLKGKHQQVDCKSCHPVEWTDSKSYQKFKGINYQSCVSCHTDPHKKNLGNHCSDCHSETSFKAFNGGRLFNHNSTAFALKGKHKSIQCAACHTLNLTAPELFQDKLGIKTTECIRCHSDPHQSKFGTNCSDCHSENGFQSMQQSDKFNHNLTAFKLEGKHEVVDCKKCHKTKFTDPVAHNRCSDCHSDYHEGQFLSTNRISDCSDCHSVHGFNITSYSIEQHATSSFPLEGAHIATPCSSCHFTNLKWKFKGLSKTCKDCHKDPHEPYINAKYYPDQNCSYCHTTSDWKEVHFDHQLSSYALEGRHKELTCMDCHRLKPGEQGHTYTHFTYKNSNCTDCHQNIHGDQFATEGKTDCKKCHNFQSWQAGLFNHDQTAFKLDGKHRDLACSACHKRTSEIPGTPIVYKIKSFQCADCHR